MAYTQSPANSSADTDMRMAHSYLNDFFDKNKTHDERHTTLKLASQYLVRAREADPNISILATDFDKKESSLHTLDSLAARCFALEGHMYAHSDNQLIRKQALEPFLKAIKYDPHHAGYRASIGKLYINMHDRETGVAALKDAVDLAPSNIEYRKELDRVLADPKAGKPIHNIPITGLIGFGCLLFFGGVATLFANVTAGMLMIVVSIVMIFISSIGTNIELKHKAIEEVKKSRG